MRYSHLPTVTDLLEQWNIGTRVAEAFIGPVPVPQKLAEVVGSGPLSSFAARELEIETLLAKLEAEAAMKVAV